MPLVDKRGAIQKRYRTAIDIDDRKQVEHAATQSQATLREQASLLDHTHDTIFVRELSYSRSRGVFTGTDLSGGVLRHDKEADARAYGTASVPMTSSKVPGG